jgi:demethylmenaquinone methyltransferase/2-methoxy-6-polyprenyl-1,4-benzoquinol methylase
MAVARAKTLPACVRFATVDAYSMAELGDQTFDAAFTGCWWSHVPLQTLPAWLATLHARLRPGARVVMLDNRFVAPSSTPLCREDEHGNTYQRRSLDDGSVHEVLKNFPTAEQANAMLGPQARHAQWLAWDHYWALSYEWAGCDAA